MPLARKLARRYSGANEPFEDLLQVASYGLLKALDRFDIDRGTAFSSFAVPTIVGEVKRYFRDLGWSAHVPRGAQELALKVQSAREKLTTRTGRSPTGPELAQYLELSTEDVLDGLEAAAAHHSSSLDIPQDDGDGESGTLADWFGHEDAGFRRVEDAATVAAAMQTLLNATVRCLSCASLRTSRKARSPNESASRRCRFRGSCDERSQR